MLQELLALKDAINNAIEGLMTSKSALAAAAETVVDQKEQIEVAKTALLASGVIDGKNQEARDAQVKSQLKVQYTALATAERNERRRRVDLELASLEYDRQKAMLRIYEIMPNMPETE